MGAITKGLLRGFATATPPVITGIEFKDIRGLLGTDRFGHRLLTLMININDNIGDTTPPGIDQQH